MREGFAVQGVQGSHLLTPTGRIPLPSCLPSCLSSCLPSCLPSCHAQGFQLSLPAWVPIDGLVEPLNLFTPHTHYRTPAADPSHSLLLLLTLLLLLLLPV